MNIQLPRLLWADSGETPVVLAEIEWNQFVLYARDNNGIWKVMTPPLTADQAKYAHSLRHGGWITDWTPVDAARNTWLEAGYAELIGDPE